MFLRRHFVALTAIAAMICPAGAAKWPIKPVRIIYPYAAGSAGDATARLIAHWLSDKLGQPFIVENRVGANGIIGTEAVARSMPDGYTLLWAITPQISISPVMTKVPYDPVSDFVPISAVAINSFALVVNAKVPAKTIPEFVAYARAQPHGLTYAEGGAGSVSHLAMVLLLNRVGVKGTNVSYKGNGPALADVIAGHLPAMFALLGDAQPQVESRTIRMLAVSSKQRSPLVPSVPTIAESGIPGYSATSWWGLMGPAGIPKPVVDRIASEVGQVVKNPKIVEQLTKFGVDPVGNKPAEFSEMISADIKLWSEAVKIAGLKAD
jgi:tripartite-type tricarboxylate transporter receptor subunit TctC